MGLDIDKEYRVKRSKSPQGTSLKKAVNGKAFAHKTKNGGRQYASRVKERIGKQGRSKEVMVKITGAAKMNEGVRNSIDYISRDDKIMLTDESGNQLNADEAKALMTDAETEFLKEKSTPDITKNIVFSPPLSAQVKPEEALEAVRKTVSEKFPGNNFVVAYHDDKAEHPHVHVIFKLKNEETGKNISIKKKDLRELRTGFCEQLKLQGYDVKATHKQIPDFKNKLKDEDAAAPKRQKDIREVVNFGRAPYQFKEGNSPQNFITVKTLNKGTESTYWGKEFGELCEREKIQKGSLIKLKKSGEETIKVPALDKDGNQTGWKETKRNSWQLENIGQKGIDRTQKSSPDKQPDLAEQLKRQQEQQRKFRQQATEMVKREQKIKVGLKF